MSEPSASIAFHQTVPSHPGVVDAPQVGTVLDARYTLVRLLGAGGMGAVYEATDTDGTPVAVKVILESLQGISGVVERFRREVSVTQALASDHVVRASDAGIDHQRGLPYMVMPLMVGFDVEQLCEDIGRLHPVVAVRIIRQACKGLMAAHDAGVIHRDIKPANLFLDHSPDGRITVRVLDLGIAKWRGEASALTHTGMMIGTPAYMAPEQFVDAKRVDERTDVWSLAVALYEMLGGSVPFADKTELAEMMKSVCDSTPPLIQDLAEWVDPGLARVVHGALIRPREHRCPTARAFHDALEPYAAGTDEMSAAMLVPIAPDVLGTAASRIELPTEWEAAEPRQPAPPITFSDDDPLLGTTLSNRFQLLRCLGQGGMGAVYEAETPERRRVAVKIIRPELAGTSRSARRRFVREAKVVQQLEHDHVVKVLEVAADAEHELPFIVMELLCGHDLERAIRKHGALRPKIVARLFLQACRGLAAAHEQGFIHRDVKPANLFLALQPSGKLCVKLCDFGIAKQLQPDPTADTTANLTRTGGVLGSPMYMSPEQATNAKTIDVRSDVWSLGASMYEALSGIPPWEGCESMGEIILAVCSRPLVHLQDRAPWVPPAFAEVVHKAMARAPDDRYASMQELAEALEPLVGNTSDVFDDDSVAVSQATRGERAQRAVQRAASTPVPGTHAGTARTLEEPTGRRRNGMVAAALIAVVVAGTAVAYLTRGDDERQLLPVAATSDATTVASPTTPTASSAMPVATTQVVRVAIVPDAAEVTVDGTPNAHDGHLELEGELGDTFTVVVSHGGQSEEAHVAITKDGPTPPRIEVRTPAVTAQGSPKPAVRPPAVAKPTAVPSATAAPPPPPVGVDGVDDWR